MARIRTVKPEFWTDEKIVSLSPLARLLFIGMWNFVDDEGRAEYSPLRMKMQILPSDSADISELLGEIRREKLITVYIVDGKEYFEVRGFNKHQKVDKRSPSKLPPPTSSAESPRTPPTEGIREGEVEASSLRSDGAASAPSIEDPRTLLFKQGLSYLSSITGKPETKLRSMVGKWLRDCDDDALRVLTVISQAHRDRPAEPVSWIESRIRPHRNGHDPPQAEAVRFQTPQEIIAQRLAERAAGN